MCPRKLCRYRRLLRLKIEFKGVTAAARLEIDFWGFIAGDKRRRQISRKGTEALSEPLPRTTIRTRVTEANEDKKNMFCGRLLV